MSAAETVLEIKELLAALVPDTPTELWHGVMEEVCIHLADLPELLAASLFAEVAHCFSSASEDFGVTPAVVAAEVRRRRRERQRAEAAPPSYDPHAHPAIGCTESDFWIATATRHPNYPDEWVWQALVSDGTVREGPREPEVLRGVASLFAGRWSALAKEDDLSLPPQAVPSLSEAFVAVRRLVSEQVEFHPDRSAEYETLVSLWILGTL